jgi:hypothetical protein
VALTDLTGSGKLDLLVVVTDGATCELSVLYGNGDGTFEPQQTIALASNTLGQYGDSIAVGDLNGDGRPDIAVSNYGTNAVNLLLGQVAESVTVTGAGVVGTGTHNVVASYSGEANFAASTSAPQQLTALAPTPRLTLTAQPGATVTYGASLSVLASVAGPEGAATPAGSVSYSVDDGAAQSAVLTTGAATLPLGSALAAGSHAVAVTYTGDPLYLTASKSIALTVTKASQTVTFKPIANITYSVSPIALSASATSRLPVTFKVVSGPASISIGNTVTVSGVGAVVVEADQTGNVDFDPASARQTFTVTPASLTVSVNSQPSVWRGEPSFHIDVHGPRRQRHGYRQILHDRGRLKPCWHLSGYGDCFRGKGGELQNHNRFGHSDRSQGRADGFSKQLHGCARQRVAWAHVFRFGFRGRKRGYAFHRRTAGNNNRDCDLRAGDLSDQYLSRNACGNQLQLCLR